MNYTKSSLTLLTVLIVLMAASLQAQQGKMRQNAMNRNYNTATVETISGSITEVTNVNTWGVHIKVKTENGVMGVHLGPDWFIKGKMTLAVGDKVAATGSKVQMNGETVIIAKSISKGNITVQLRNDNGVPLWAGSGKGKNR
jgi:preprotein translocase subunit YajC